MTSSISNVVVTGHKDDLKFVKKIAESLQSLNLSVWYETSNGDDPAILQRRSQAIMGCKIFVPVLSVTAVQEKIFNDELSLAYITNSAIFPIGLQEFPEISSKLDGGSRLILARINWIFFTQNTQYDDSVKNLIKSINQQVKADENEEEFQNPGFIETHGLIINTQFNHIPPEEEEEETMETEPVTPDTPTKQTPVSKKHLMSLDFWDRHFPKKTEVKYTDFKDKFQNDYSARITELYPADKQRLFLNLMYRDVFNMSKTVQRSVYNKFCSHNPYADPHCFYRNLQEYVIAHISLRKVFNMNSTLRITTIQNLGKFTFPAIINGLTDMLKDEDPNIRAVAAIALAKSGKNRTDTVDKLVSLLEDEDRLVRESALLSLGYLKAVKAVDHVVNRWRNDPISTVREAASLALKRMNIEEAQQCIKVTEVLSNEMQALKPR